jgi:hypothetical protein
MNSNLEHRDPEGPVFPEKSDLKQRRRAATPMPSVHPSFWRTDVPRVPVMKGRIRNPFTVGAYAATISTWKSLLSPLRFFIEYARQNRETMPCIGVFDGFLNFVQDFFDVSNPVLDLIDAARKMPQHLDDQCSLSLFTVSGTIRSRYVEPTMARGIKPFHYCVLSISECFLLRFAIRHAAKKVRDIPHEPSAIFF